MPHFYKKNNILKMKAFCHYKISLSLWITDGACKPRFQMIYDCLFEIIPQTPAVLGITNFKFSPLGQVTRYLYCVIKFCCKIFFSIRKNQYQKYDTSFEIKIRKYEISKIIFQLHCLCEFYPHFIFLKSVNNLHYLQLGCWIWLIVT